MWLRCCSYCCILKFDMVGLRLGASGIACDRVVPGKEYLLSKTDWARIT